MRWRSLSTLSTRATSVSNGHPFSPTRAAAVAASSGVQRGHLKLSWPAGISSGAYMPPFRP
jgi:hypothetical protein